MACVHHLGGMAGLGADVRDALAHDPDRPVAKAAVRQHGQRVHGIIPLFFDDAQQLVPESGAVHFAGQRERLAAQRAAHVEDHRPPIGGQLRLRPGQELSYHLRVPVSGTSRDGTARRRDKEKRCESHNRSVPSAVMRVT